VDEHGYATGFSVELLRAALAAMDRDVTFKTGPWAQVRGWLAQGEIQALPLVGRTPERELLFDFTFPYMTLHGAIVVRKGTSGITDIEDLKGKQVAVMKDDNAEEFLRRKDRGIDIVTRPTFETALRELADGSHDAVFIQRLVALRLIQENGITGLEVSRHPVADFYQDFCFAVTEGDRDTLALLNEGLALVMADGTFRRLHARWFAALQLPLDRPVIIGGDHNYPPFEFLDETGHPAGFTVDLTRAIAREMHMEIQIRLRPWAEVVNSVKTGDIDAVQGMFYSAERDRMLDFSSPHLVSYYVGVVQKGNGPPPETVSDLAGKQLVVQDGDVVLEFLAKADLMDQVSIVENQAAVLQAVSDGQYECALVPRISALYLIKENGWTNLDLGSRHFFSGEYGYAVKEGRNALLAQFSEGLKVLEQSGEYRRIHDKWLGVYQEQKMSVSEFLRNFALVVIPLVLVLVVVFLWSWSLRRQVARKTRELNASEEFQRAMIACSPVALFSIDLAGKVLVWNDSARNIFGWTPEEVMGRPLPIVPGEKYQEFEDLRRQVLEKGFIKDIEIVRQKKDGTCFDASLSAAPVHDSKGNMIGIMGAVEDITARKRAREHIHHLNQVLRAIQEINQLMIHEQDQDTLIKEGCRLLVAHRGYPSAMIVLTDAENTPVSWGMAGLAADSDELDRMLKNGDLSLCCMRAGKAKKTVLINDQQTACRGCPISEGCSQNQTVCVPLIHMEKSFGYLSVAAENEITEGDEEYQLLNEMGQDFAYALSGLKTELERQKGKAALQESEQRFRTFAELAPVGIVISDEHQNTLYASPKFTEMFGYTLDEMPSVDKWWSLAYPDPEFRTQVRQDWQNAVAEAVKTGSEIFPREYPVTCKDGSIRHTEFRMATTGKLNIVVFTDISERKKHEKEQEKLQSQLLQAQKMESVGRLAGGVAHDFNNMLAVIIGYAELGVLKTPPENPLHPDMKEILTAARRSSEITKQLLAFARKQTINPRMLDLNETVESMLKMLQRLIGEDIHLSWQPGAGLRSVYMDPTQVDQILANLVVNARDAIAGVGSITIETETVRFDADYCDAHAGFTPGDYVLLAVSDDGCGMDRETQDRLFEPFFSTKEIGKGTGLGLATIYGIVKQNNGFINVYSEPDSGTTFRIYLPCHAGEPGLDVSENDTPVPEGRGETILIVEDEISILEIAKKMLEIIGYRVLVAPSADLALASAKAHGADIRLLISDVIMPGMNGRDLADRIQAFCPDIKILFMSGYTADVIAHRGVLDAGVHFIQKPFSRSDLARKVRHTLDGVRS
jgi:PAS domain S-box-containing protein